MKSLISAIVLAYAVTAQDPSDNQPPATFDPAPQPVSNEDSTTDSTPEETPEETTTEEIGCTDSAATNYDPSANIDDGTCNYVDTDNEDSENGQVSAEEFEGEEDTEDEP